MRTSEEIELDLEAKLAEIEDLENRLEDIEYLLESARDEYKALEAEYSDKIDEEVFVDE
ncbi:hypothetical protein [Bacillus velezensis]|uniref:hypothetical protein n=1 Tax=Bacillus velezensis TaxID=492670 RepID=UPI00146B3B1B|nr:hypothetical protein [Bacillus velezensis]NMW10802.1 hypothetical protein [Bacillus velezensis]